MKKTILLKIVTLVILNVFVISLGLTTFATTDSAIMPRWSYLGQCGYSFEIWEETDNYDVLLCGGDVSTTNPNHYAFLTTTNFRRLLPTIVSRCQLIHFKPVPKNYLIDKLIDCGIEKDISYIISYS